MAVILLVPETKIADVGKLISLGNLLVMEVAWWELTTTSATLILSRAFWAGRMTRIAYIYSRLPRTHSVIYWPSTEPSIKRCTCVNKLKKSGSRWTLRKNIDRVPVAISQLRQECQNENQLAEGWAFSDPRLSNPRQDAKEVPLWSREELESI